MKDIFSFPDDVFLYILSFLTMKEAISTSLVSKKWQKMLCSLPSLCFDDGSNSKRIKKVDAYKFMNFVDGVLFTHEGDVHKFSLNCGVFVDHNRIRRWIKYAISNRVRELDLDFCHDLNTLPLMLFTSQTLEVLRVRITKRIHFKLPANICLPNLKILHLFDLLDREQNDSSSIQRLISSCAKLEELEIDNCSFDQNCGFSIPTLKRLMKGSIKGTIQIDAPNLVYFKCYNFEENFPLKNLNSLVEAEMDFGVRGVFDDTTTIDLFKAISNVKSLRMSGAFRKVFIRVGSLLPQLSKLTHLSFESKFDTRWENWISVLPQCCPYVETLDWNVKIQGGWRILIKEDLPPPCSWPELKKINFLSFGNSENELQMIEYLLENAVSLEKLTVRSVRSVKLNSITRKLFKFKQASNKCNIIVL